MNNFHYTSSAPAEFCMENRFCVTNSVGSPDLGLGATFEIVRLLLDSFSRDSYLVDPASSHMLVSKIKPCMSKYKQILL